ncbi:MAG: serine--tRNA ligase [Chloroflexota bacterium]
MLPVAYIREHVEEVRQRLSLRHASESLDKLVLLDAQRRAVLGEAQALRERRNAANEAIKRAGRPNAEQRLELRALSDRIKALDGEQETIDRALNDLALSLPNLPHADVPVGATDQDNVEYLRWGEHPHFAFAPRPHWEVGEQLGIYDPEAGVKLAGARFYVTRGLGARLQRALMAFFLDTHVAQHGYTEVALPYLVRSAAMLGSAKLPKFADDAYFLREDDLWLNPTAEVALTDLHRDDILAAEQLPLRYTAYCPSWRREAGSAGRDTRGTIRLHQFHKVELYTFCRPEESYQQYDRLVADAEDLLQALGLPYRGIRICTADLGFTAAAQIDLEVWLPGLAEFREISSISNCEAFQARRANIRFRRAAGERPEFVHTLNGSGLPIDRAFAAILENYQQEDGSVVVPPVLRQYMGTDVIRQA